MSVLIFSYDMFFSDRVAANLHKAIFCNFFIANNCDSLAASPLHYRVDQYSEGKHYREGEQNCNTLHAVIIADFLNGLGLQVQSTIGS